MVMKLNMRCSIRFHLEVPGEHRPHQIGGHHHSTTRKPIGQQPGHRSEQQHGRHLEGDRGRDANPGAGEAKHQHHKRDGVERIAGT
jgi:hypothetical protein